MLFLGSRRHRSRAARSARGAPSRARRRSGGLSRRAVAHTAPHGPSDRPARRPARPARRALRPRRRGPRRDIRLRPRSGRRTITDGLLDRLTNLQERLWAEQQRSVLIVLQGIDAAGKDGTIRKVMTAFNPQGCPVASFKVPSTEELAHDFLWRIHRRVPGRGEIGIFNRSHYEDVLVVRVHELVPKDVWKARYDQIVAFEDHLTANGTTIVKFFLYIDKDEQLERFRARYEDPTKRWKFALGDLEERKRWDDYIAALPGRAGEDVDGSCAVVRHPRQQEVVPRPRHRVDRGRHAPGARSAVPGTRGPAGGAGHRVSVSNRSPNSITQPATKVAELRDLVLGDTGERSLPGQRAVQAAERRGPPWLLAPWSVSTRRRSTRRGRRPRAARTRRPVGGARSCGQSS